MAFFNHARSKASRWGAKGFCAPGRDRRSATRSPRATELHVDQRLSIGAKVIVSKPYMSRSAPGIVARFDDEQIFDADAESAFAVIAGFVRQDHAGFERDARRVSRCAAAPRARER